MLFIVIVYKSQSPVDVGFLCFVGQILGPNETPKLVEKPSGIVWYNGRYIVHIMHVKYI